MPAGDLNIRQAKLRQDAAEDFLLVLGKVAPGFFTDDLEVIDEHFGCIKIDFGLPRGGVGHLPQTKRRLLGLHHHEFYETLGDVGGVCGLLYFSHVDLYGGFGKLFRDLEDKNQLRESSHMREAGKGLNDHKSWLMKGRGGIRAGRSHYDLDTFAVAEIFLGGALDIVQGHFLNLLRANLVMLVS